MEVEFIESLYFTWRRILFEGGLRYIKDMYCKYHRNHTHTHTHKEIQLWVEIKMGCWKKKKNGMLKIHPKKIEKEEKRTDLKINKWQDDQSQTDQ